MNNLIHFFSNEFVAALGWSLLHSLWQGALIALLLGFVLLFLQKRSSNLRYTLAASSLGLTLVAFFGTFTYLFNAAKAEQQAFNDTLYIVTQENYNELANQLGGNQSLFSIFLEYFNEHLPIIVVFWLLGVLVLSLRFLGGLAYLKRLRYTQNQTLEKHWQERLNSIKLQIGLNKSVELLESALIKVPMVIGYMKPIILLPIGTINTLSVAEVEAILAHELAHVKRNDYLVNLIQSIIDVLFFYHPAVWWMSNTVRAERENCCDDLALTVTGNSLIIAKALANLESLRQRSYHLSLAFTGNKNQLFNRISRLLGQPMKKNNHFVEGIVAVIVIILCLTTINYKVNAAVTETEKELTEIVTDSIIPKEEIIVETDEEVIEEYILIEEEIENSFLSPNPPSAIRWMSNENEHFVFPEAPNAPEPLFSKGFELIDGEITRSWINENDETIFLKKRTNGSNRFLIPAPEALKIVPPANIEAPNYLFEMSEMPRLEGLEMPERPEKPSIHIMSSGKSKFLFDDNYEYKFKIKNSKDIDVEVHSFNAIPDTSILDDAEIIIIDGDKVTVVRKKSKLSKSDKARLKSKLKRLERLEELDDLQIERSVKRMEIEIERQIEDAERRMEAEEKRLEAEMKRLEVRVEMEENRAKAQIKRIELQEKAQIKREEERMKREEERMQREEERMERAEERMQREEERMQMAEERANERARQEEERAKRNQRLEKALKKDGILKSNEKLETMNINKNNGEVTIRINGKKLSEEQTKKYIKMLED